MQVTFQIYKNNNYVTENQKQSLPLTFVARKSVVIKKLNEVLSKQSISTDIKRLEQYYSKVHYLNEQDIEEISSIFRKIKEVINPFKNKIQCKETTKCNIPVSKQHDLINLSSFLHGNDNIRLCKTENQVAKRLITDMLHYINVFCTRSNEHPFLFKQVFGDIKLLQRLADIKDAYNTKNCKFW